MYIIDWSFRYFFVIVLLYKQNVPVQKGCVFTSDLFNIYSGAILMELAILTEFIIGELNLTNIRYTNNTALLVDQLGRKSQNLLDRVMEESEE